MGNTSEYWTDDISNVPWLPKTERPTGINLRKLGFGVFDV